MKRFKLKAGATDCRTSGRVILAEGEVTGHCHEVFLGEPQFFEEPDGRRVLIALEPCELRHQEHGTIALDPANPVQVRQGDVLLNPIGIGAWEVIRQREYSPEAIRQVAD